MEETRYLILIKQREATAYWQLYCSTRLRAGGARHAFGAATASVETVSPPWMDLGYHFGPSVIKSPALRARRICIQNEVTEPIKASPRISGRHDRACARRGAKG